MGRNAMQTANGIPLLGYGTYPLTGAECRDGVAMALDGLDQSDGFTMKLDVELGELVVNV